MTFNAIALEIATLKRLGLFRKPISESNASRVVGRVTTVEMKMIVTLKISRGQLKEKRYTKQIE